jgi:hypothetical protein
MPETAPPTQRRRVRPLTITLLVLCAGMTVLWVYAFFIADPQNPNRIEDEAWTERAKEVCTATRERLDALSDVRDLADVEPLEEALRQRAEIGEDATDLVEAMVDDLDRLPSPSGDGDSELVDLWLADWRAHIADRRAHIERWRAGEDAPFRETAFNDRPLGIRMADFSNLNRMESCGPPGDFG